VTPSGVTGCGGSPATLLSDSRIRTSEPLRNQHAQDECHACSSKIQDPFSFRSLALFFGQIGDMISKSATITLRYQIIQEGQLRVRHGLHQCLIGSQRSFNSRYVCAIIISEMIRMFQLECCSVEYDLLIDLS